MKLKKGKIMLESYIESPNGLDQSITLELRKFCGDFAIRMRRGDSFSKQNFDEFVYAADDFDVARRDYYAIRRGFASDMLKQCIKAEYLPLYLVVLKAFSDVKLDKIGVHAFLNHLLDMDPDVIVQALEKGLAH